MTNWSSFNLKNTLLTPYISEVQGTALIGTLSEITITGFNFNPNSQIICNAGIISDIQISPELIIFNILADTPGSYPVEVKNNNLSSNDWNSPYQAILIARNPLNLTDGWLDFRIANSANFGSVISHINQNLSIKNFANSGYSLDASRGLIFNHATSTANSPNNYIQFNSYLFPLDATKYEIFANFDTTFTTIAINRLRAGLATSGNFNTLIASTDYTGGNFIFTSRFLSPYLNNVSLYLGNVNSQLLNNNFYYLKFVFDFIFQKIEIHKLTDNSNLDADNKIEEFPLNPLNRTMNVDGVPLFNFFNSGSLSSVIAIKIE